MDLMTMAHYTKEQRSSIVSDYQSSDLSLREYAAANGIAKSTLYTWSTLAASEPVNMKTPQYSAEKRFQMVLETAKLSEAELSQYCRKEGVFPADIHKWRQACIAATQPKIPSVSAESKADKKRIRQLEKDLNRKDKALAETTALLVLRKKFNAIYGLDEDH